LTEDDTDEADEDDDEDDDIEDEVEVRRDEPSRRKQFEAENGST
jgi:hypothetical protein